MEIEDLYEDAVAPAPPVDDAPIDAQTPPVVTDDIPLDKPADAPDGTPAPADNDLVDPVVPKDDPITLSGVEQYLSRFDIEGGMISFDDGESKHFDDLDSDKQAEILSNLHKQSETSVEDKYGLNESEIGIINHLRENNQSVDEMVEEMATKRVETLTALGQSTNRDLDAMSEEAVYTAFLKSSNAQITDEQVEKDLTAAKTMSNFKNVVSKLRADMGQEQKRLQAASVQEQKDTLNSTIEDQRRLVVETVQGIDTLDGLGINDGIKNNVLDTILSVDDDGDSVFMTEVFSDPKKLFRAAFWYNNGTDILKSREDYWKKQKSDAFKRGQESVSSGGQTFTKKKNTTPNHSELETPESFDDLYDD